MMIKDRTLDQIVEDVSKVVPEAVFYIGSTGGSGFFFIGTAEEYHNDIDTLNEKWCRYLENFKAKKEKAVHDMVKSLSNMTYSDMGNRIRNRWDSVSKNLSELKTYEDAVAEWVTMRNRIPTKIYKKDHVIDPNGLIINVRGIEDGGCWFPHDYQKLKNENFRRLRPSTADEKEDTNAEDA